MIAMIAMLPRRALLRGALVAIVALVTATSCKKEERCQNCGMKIDRASAWRAEVVLDDRGGVAEFDTPRCALTAFKTGKVKGKSVRVQEYYDRTMRDAAGLRFVAGADVSGPMGPDLVPVDPTRVDKFIQDHTADRAYTFDEITPAILSSLK